MTLLEKSILEFQQGLDEGIYLLHTQNRISDYNLIIVMNRVLLMELEHQQICKGILGTGYLTNAALALQSLDGRHPVKAWYRGIEICLHCPDNKVYVQLRDWAFTHNQATSVVRINFPNLMSDATLRIPRMQMIDDCRIPPGDQIGSSRYHA